MKTNKTIIISLILAVALLFSSCSFFEQEEILEIDNTLKDKCEIWQTSSQIKCDYIKFTILKDEEKTLHEYLPLEFEGKEVTWASECENIVSVSKNGEILGKKYGRTLVTAKAEGLEKSFLITVDFLVSKNNGYTFNTVKRDGVYKVDSIEAADRLMDKCIVEHIGSLSLDFSVLGEDFAPLEDYNYNYELATHVSFQFGVSPFSPQVLKVKIVYNHNAGSEAYTPTPENTFLSVTNGNMLARRYYYEKYSKPRADDFDGFAINESKNGKMPVTNTEELWWCLEEGYIPVFPTPNSKAELIYEHAKIILREIIYEGMNDFEKAIAIYEYLIDAVAYDYEAYSKLQGSNKRDNVCYYLEGVFEYGRAVCDGKTKAFVLLCGIEGIECVRDCGSAINGGFGHSWNYVKLQNEWYMVDTTVGDVALANRGEDRTMPAFYGKNIEIINYAGFGLPLLYHKDEYVYSGVFDEITESEGSHSIYDKVYDANLSGSANDFVINDVYELSDIISAINKLNVADEFILTIRYEGPPTSPYVLIKNAMKLADCEYEIEIYTVGEMDADSIYVAFK